MTVRGNKFEVYVETTVTRSIPRRKIEGKKAIEYNVGGLELAFFFLRRSPKTAHRRRHKIQRPVRQFLLPFSIIINTI